MKYQRKQTKARRISRNSYALSSRCSHEVQRRSVTFSWHPQLASDARRKSRCVGGRAGGCYLDARRWSLGWAGEELCLSI